MAKSYTTRVKMVSLVSYCHRPGVWQAGCYPNGAMVDKGFVCYDFCLLDSIHSFDNLHIDIALIFDYVQQVILIDDLLWYSCYV